MKRARAVAVGQNALILAHEAGKAAFQIATGLEATQRSILTKAERVVIEELTNSNVAEIRQFIFGEIMKSKIQGLIQELTGKTERRVYADMVGQIFSLLPRAIFMDFVEDAFRAREANDVHALRRKYGEYLHLSF